MSRKIVVILLSLALTLCAICLVGCSSDKEEINYTQGLEYVFSQDKTSCVCKGLGTAQDEEIVIASEYEGVPVKGIGGGAFAFKSSITSITIPEGVTSIGATAFRYCDKLENFTFQGTQEQWKAISKGDRWNQGLKAKIVHCVDGDLEIS